MDKNDKSLDIGLGYYQEIADLFRLGDGAKDSPDLTEALTFVFSQTLLRDGFYGSWAQAYRNGDGEYRLKITSPSDDVSSYSQKIPAYIAAGQIAVKSYYDNIPEKAREGWEFLMPFGLAMANVKSVQLLHFPPLETFTYKDYLYSPTNRRWECLLAQNGFDGARNTLLERIVDVAPIAAPGGAGAALTDYNEDFVPYAMAQLRNFLDPVPGTTVTQPVVAYGGPVHDWLKQAFKLNETPTTLDLVALNIAADSSGKQTTTWVLCANHPSEYLYDTDLPLSDATKPNGDYPAPMAVMGQDLIAAGWQAHMADHPDDDPHPVLEDMKQKWGWDDKTHSVRAEKHELILRIMREQNEAFSLDNNHYEPTDAQCASTVFAIQRDSDSERYGVLGFDAASDKALTSIPTADSATLSAEHRLTQVGGFMLDWTMPSSDDDEIHYRLVRFDRDSRNPLAEESVGYGTWSKDKFFNRYRPNYGASFSDIELYGFPGYVLSVIPAAGRRTYQLWNFDPFAEDDCLNAGDFKSGGFRDIPADRELHPIGNYVLDRKGSEFKVWSFDPQTNPPLSLPVVARGTWSQIDETDCLMVLADDVFTWKPETPSEGYRIWKFNPRSDQPLGNQPFKTGQLPESFKPSTTLTAAIPSVPEKDTKSKTPGTIEFMREEIQHVVYYMLESRSFDNVIGWLYERGKKEGLNWIGANDGGFRGLDASMKNPLPGGKDAFVSQYQNGELSRQFVLGGPAQDPWHDNSDVLMQMFHGYDGYAKRQTAKMNGFAWNQDSAAVLSSFTPQQLSVLNGLAQNFAVSDDWFASVPGGTDLNRGFSVSGSGYNRLGTWEGGAAYANWPDTPHRQSLWKTLWSQGHRDWKIYYSILWQNAVFTHQLYLKGQIPEVDDAWASACTDASEYGSPANSQWIAPLAQLYDDIKNDNLPKFAYLEPAWEGADCTSYHPGSSHGELASLVPGEKALNDLYVALSSNPEVWKKTLLVVTFDKNGGLFDNVAPPYAPKPWPNDKVDGFEFDLLGPRIPVVFASPWIQSNTVIRSASQAPFEATSFGATLLDWYGINRASWGLGDRMAQAPTFEAVLNGSSPQPSAPTLTVPYDKDFPPES
jgi:phospholipase C